MPLDLVWLEPEDFPAWRFRMKAETAGRHLTHTRLAALLALLTFYGPEGLFPSDAEVAARTGCSARTVQRARMDARDLGALTWEHSRKRAADGRWRQGPNVYQIKVPSTPVCPGRQVGRLTEKVKKERGQQHRERPQLRPKPPQLDLLTARNAMLMERMRAGWRPGTAVHPT